MKLKGKSVAMFIANMFEDIEHLYPYFRMKEEGADVTVIGPNAEEFHGVHGNKAKADKGINEVRPENFDAMLIPGGFSPDYMRRSPAMAEFVKQMHDQGKPVAAICHGPWMLASAGIIKNTRVTSFPTLKDDLRNAGAEWVDQEVVIDNNIITSRNPNDLPAYCRSFIDYLAAIGVPAAAETHR